ncbi:hypothetical protein GGR52DRAFT_516026 [Hypoxylon sp. FL1284]|nr:hypothetical protein GGR52DRAFT_516026 [Hypoxylon sp. FL1284]
MSFGKPSQPVSDNHITEPRACQPITSNQHVIELSLSQPVRMSPTLSRLPAEVLRDIFSRLADQDDKGQAYRDLYALTRTCRRLSGLAVHLLYADINFYVNANGKHSRLLDYCRQKPFLVDRIHSVQIVFSGGETANLLWRLSQSTSLTKLNISYAFGWSQLPVFFNYDYPSYAAVRELQIGAITIQDQNGYVPANELAQLCELPSLEKLTIWTPVGGFQGAPQPSQSTKTIANLRHLHFCKQRPVSVEALELVLDRCPSLKYLELSIPGAATDVRRMVCNGMSQNGFDLDEPLRPAFYGKLLAPAATSLTSLAIYASNVQFPSHDGSRIDLSGFANLLELGCSTSLLFDPEKTASSSASSRDLWRYLPPRIEHLCLVFDGDQGIFWSLQDMREHARVETFQDLWTQTYCRFHVGWLTELLRRRREDDNQLKMITLDEEVIADNDQNWKIVHWHMTDPLKAAARAAGAELIVRLRVPYKFESPDFHVVMTSWAFGEPGTVVY